MDIKSINDKKQLKNLLNDLKFYKYATKKLWKRGRKVYKNKISDTSSYKVEFFPSIKEDIVIKEALKVYKDTFKDDISQDQISFIKNDNLDWWIRIYKDDNMVDLSFKKIEEKLKVI